MVRWYIRTQRPVHVLIPGLLSLISRSRLEDIFNSRQLDRRNRVAQTYSWSRESPIGFYVLSPTPSFL